MKKRYYNIHDLIKIKLCCKNSEDVNYFDRRLKYFKSQNLLSADINIYFNMLPAGTTKLSLNAFSNKGKIVYDKAGRKFAKWETYFRSIEDGKIEIFFFGNKFSCKYLFFNFLEPLINAILVKKGFCLVHASCFSWEDKGVLVSAYPASGKTSILLRMLKKGANYLADEMAIISQDGFAYSYPTLINLSDYNLKGKLLKKIGIVNVVKKYVFRTIRILTKGFVKLTVQISPENILNGGKIKEKTKVNRLYVINNINFNRHNALKIKEAMFDISKVQYAYFDKVIKKHVESFQNYLFSEYWSNMTQIIDDFCENTECSYVAKGTDFNLNISNIKGRENE